MNTVTLTKIIITFSYTAADTVPGNCENPPLDISIVIDRTKSVGANNYDKMLDSVKDLISSYEVGKDKTHFSIVTFADQAEVRVSLGDSKYYSKAALYKRLDEMKAKDKLGGVTRTDRALKTVGEEVFVKKNGDRPGSPNVMIILTDGATNKLSEPYDTVLPTLEVRCLFQFSKPERIQRRYLFIHVACKQGML